MMLRVSICKEASWKKFIVVFLYVKNFSYKFNINFAACLTSCTDRALQITSVCTELSALWDGMYYFFLLMNCLFFKEHETGIWLNIYYYFKLYKNIIINFIDLSYYYQIPEFFFS